MLAEAIIRIGRPIKNGSLSPRERIRLLTDVTSDNCKNYFKNVFLIEINGGRAVLQYMELGNAVKTGKKEDFIVDQKRAVAFPVFFPHGGNPLLAQGIYALPCYLMYDPHIKAIGNRQEFTKDFLLPRFKSTLQYKELSEKVLNDLADMVSSLFAVNATKFIVAAFFNCPCIAL